MISRIHDLLPFFKNEYSVTHIFPLQYSDPFQNLVYQNESLLRYVFSNYAFHSRISISRKLLASINKEKKKKKKREKLISTGHFAEKQGVTTRFIEKQIALNLMHGAC